MAESINDITGDSLVTKASSEAYRNNYDLIFRKPVKTEEPVIQCNNQIVKQPEGNENEKTDS